MKKIITLLASLCITSICIAQNGINYKAVITDNSGNIVINTPILVKFELREDIDGLLAYSETHNTTTDDNGIVVLIIGTGTPITGIFDNFFSSEIQIGLNVQVDIGGGLVDMGTTAFNYVPYAYHSETAKVAQNLSGLELIIEGGSFGYRFVNAVPQNYGNIGSFAVDLSFNPTTSSIGGATGQNAFATGLSTRAAGLASTATGFDTRVLGDYAIAMGNSTIADGDSSTSMGINTWATGTGSFAFGNRTTAGGNNSVAGGIDSRTFGNNSVALGFDTYAIGNRSVALGNNTTAYAYNSLAIGRFNIGTGTNNIWVSEEPLFEIGIGSSSSIRDNALTVLKNGNIGVGTYSPQELLHIDGGRLRIGTETIEDTGNNRLSFNASLLPDVDDAMNLGNLSFRWNAVWSVDGTINTSDRRDKTNIADLAYGLDAIMKLEPVSFNWKRRPHQDTKLGLIAQDLFKVIPEVVKTHDDVVVNDKGETQRIEAERLGVYYSDLIPVLIKAIQEQQILINNQNIELKLSKQNYDSLLSRIEQLETKSLN